MTSQRESIQRVLVLGDAAAGKTTFLVQLHGRVSGGQGNLRTRGAPESLEAIEQGFRRLQQGLAVAHTSHGTETSLNLPCVSLDGQPVDIVVPDYAGEDLRRLVDDRRVQDRWRAEAGRGDQWLLMIRLGQHAEVPDILTHPIGELARAPLPTADADPQTLPMDMWAVELLQALLHTRRLDAAQAPPLPRLTLVLSCWDELDADAGTMPDSVARERLALLDSYCRATWGSRYSVTGLSAQGRTLDETEPDAEYVDDGPQDMGWVVKSTGERDADLTLLFGQP